MNKTHIILVGFGDVGTKIFPALMQINQDKSDDTGSIEISIVDIKSWDDILTEVKPKLRDRFRNYSKIEYNEGTILKFLKENYFEDKNPDSNIIPDGLLKRIKPERTIVYLALDPDKYLDALRKYLPFGNIFALEKPLAKNSEKAIELINYTRENANFFGKQFIPIDHYLGKYAVNLFKKISSMDRFSIIKDSNIIVFSFLEENISSPSEQPYFASTGIIADMMPHVSALLTKILKTKFMLEPKQVKSSILDSYDIQCESAGILSCKETYAEIELNLSEIDGPNRTVIVRIGKGIQHEDRSVAFVDSTGDILLMKLPHSKLEEGEVLLKSKSLTGELRVDIEKPASEKWDDSWYNIFKGLKDKEFSQFLTMDDANEIVRMIEDINEKKLNIVKHDNTTIPPYLGFDWENYTWHNKTDYAVIFNLNGVLIDNRDSNMKAWKTVMEQLKIIDYDEYLLNSLTSSGLTTKEILVYMLGKYYQEKLDGSSVEILASNWARVKEQRYLITLMDDNVKAMKGSVAFLKSLTDNRIKIGLYSILSRHFVLQILHLLKVKQFFSVVVTPELIRSDYRNENNFVGCLNEVTARMDINKEKCFLLEDSIGHVDKATEMGIECIGFGLDNKQELIGKGAICVVDDHTILLDAFKASNNWEDVRKKLRTI